MSLYRKAANGDGEEQLVASNSESSLPGGIGAPAFAERSAGSFSLVANWVAYQSTKSGTREIYARALDRPEEHRISTMGGAYPRWRADGKELFYVTPENSMMAVAAKVSEPVRFGPPKSLFHVCSARRSDSQNPDYDVTPDGRWFLFSCQSQEIRKRSITVAILWLDMINHPALQERRSR